MQLKNRYLCVALLLIALLFVLPAQAQEQEGNQVGIDDFTFALDPELATHVNITRFVGEPVDEAQPWWTPSPHTRFTLYNSDTMPELMLDAEATIHLYALHTMEGYTAHINVVDSLRDLLSEKPNLSEYEQVQDSLSEVTLPFLPIFPAAQVIRARATYVETDAIEGIAYLTIYRQDASPFLAHEFIYTFQGLSKDGTHYVSLVIPVAATMFPTELPHNMDWDEFIAGINTYHLESVTSLNSGTSDDFQPSLILGQALAESITFGMEHATIPSFAADNAGTLIYEDSTDIFTDLITADAISDIAWNADGKQIAVILQTRVPEQNDVWELGYVDVSAMPIETGILQTNRPAIGYPVNWMRDGRLLFAAQNPQANPQTGLNDKIDLFATIPGETPELLGTFAFGGECGGGSDQPADWRYWSEIGGMDVFLTLADTPFGIVHSTECSGSRLALLDPATGESKLIAEYLIKAVVSPDATRIAGIALDYTTQPLTSNLVVYDLATGVSRTIATEAEPTLVAWNLDGTALYYATRTFDRNLVETMSQEVIERFTDALGYDMESIPAYSVVVYHVSLSDENTSVVYTGDAYAIGRIIETPDAVFISRVPNMMSWIERVVNGDLAVHDRDASLEAVEAEVMMIDRTGAIFGPESFVGYFEQFTPFVSR